MMRCPFIVTRRTWTYIGTQDSAGQSDDDVLLSQHRVLLFAQNKATLDLIEHDLFKGKKKPFFAYRSTAVLSNDISCL